MNNNDKGVIASGWFGLEHHREIHTVDFYRHIGMETLCKLYPEIFKPEIWLSENPPQIKQSEASKIVVNEESRIPF